MASQQTIHHFHWHYDEFDDKNFELHGHSLVLLLIVFAILLLVTLLCLYARWFCRDRQRAAITSPVDGDRRAASLPTALGLDPATVSSFPVLLHQASAGDEAQCSICLGNVVEGEKVKVLPACSHGFHPECVDEWLKTRSSCPLCRASLGGSAEFNPHPVAAMV